MSIKSKGKRKLKRDKKLIILGFDSRLTILDPKA